MQFEYIDVHSHIFFDEFNKDRKEVIKRMLENSVATINVGVDLESSKKAISFTKENREISIGASVGHHPTNKNHFDEEEFEKLIQSEEKNIVAIGECGLDYFRIDTSYKNEKKRQTLIFEKHIHMAIKYNIPLMLHIRASRNSTDAYKDAFEILKTYKKENPHLKMHLHFFTAPTEIVYDFLNLDATFGIPGVVTFAKEVENSVKQIPIEKILVESDSPYASPIPYRGKRNEPVYTINTLKHIANIKNIEYEFAKRQILKNTIKQFMNKNID